MAKDTYPKTINANALSRDFLDMCIKRQESNASDKLVPEQIVLDLNRSGSHYHHRFYFNGKLFEASVHNDNSQVSQDALNHLDKVGFSHKALQTFSASYIQGGIAALFISPFNMMGAGLRAQLELTEHDNAQMELNLIEKDGVLVQEAFIHNLNLAGEEIPGYVLLRLPFNQEGNPQADQLTVTVSNPLLERIATSTIEQVMNPNPKTFMTKLAEVRQNQHDDLSEANLDGYEISSQKIFSQEEQVSALKEKSLEIVDALDALYDTTQDQHIGNIIAQCTELDIFGEEPLSYQQAQKELSTQIELVEKYLSLELGKHSTEELCKEISTRIGRAKEKNQNITQRMRSFFKDMQSSGPEVKADKTEYDNGKDSDTEDDDENRPPYKR